MKRAFLTVIASATVMLSMAQIALEDLHTATFEMKEPERFNIVDDATHVWDRVFAIREDTLKDCWRFYTTGGAKVSSLLWYSMEPHFNEGVCAVKRSPASSARPSTTPASSVFASDSQKPTSSANASKPCSDSVIPTVLF